MSAEQIQGAQGRSVQSTWLFTLGSIVFFLGFLDVVVALTLLDAYLSANDPLTAVLLLLLIVASATQLRYCWFLRAGRGGGLPHPGWTVALVAPAAIMWLLGLFASGSELTAAVPLWAAATLIACLLPRTQRWLTLAAGVVALIGHPLIAGLVLDAPSAFPNPSTVWMIGLYSALLPFMLLSSLWWWEIVVKLDRHRRTAAELAVTQERLRFASDLHDIQGHHLQVISLKSELAERLLAVDPEAARAHIHETRLIAKQALEETRSLVAGYRQVELGDELENAREVLTAAGADCELRLGALPSDAAVRSALASVVREATTNILRHSDAARVTIALTTASGRTELTIANDGVATSPARDPGSGLAGLRERLAAIGGALETSLDASGERFELRASVPVTAEVTA